MANSYNAYVGSGRTIHRIEDGNPVCGSGITHYRYGLLTRFDCRPYAVTDEVTCKRCLGILEKRHTEQGQG